MTYEYTKLSDHLIYIRLTDEPTKADDDQHVEHSKKLLDGASEPLFFLVDFRGGVTTNLGTISKLAEMTRHPLFGASIAFSNERIRKLYARLFTALTDQGLDRDFFDTAEEAVAYLESLKAGLTVGIDWRRVLK